MGEVIGEVIPLALAIAVSPFSIIPAILLLFTPRARAASAAFLAGWILGICASTTAFVLLATVIEAVEGTPTWASWTRIALGLVLVAMGLRRWLGRRTPKPAPAWMQSIEAAGPRTAFRLALVLAVANPKVLLLSAAAGLAIGAAELPAVNAVGAVVVFTVVAASSVAIPVVLYAIRGERILVPLGKARDWLVSNNASVMAVVFTVIGVSLIVKGAAAL